MQMQWSESFKSRVLFNASKAYIKQLDKSDQYNLLQPVYSLNLVNKNFEPTEEFYHHYKIVNIADTEKQIKGLEFVFVELPKFQPQNISEKKLMVLWLRYLTEISDSDNVPAELLENEDIKNAVEYLEVSSYTKAELEIYDKVQDAIRTHLTYIYDAKEEGLREGEEMRKKLAEKLEEKDKVLEEKDKALEEVCETFTQKLEEKNKALEEKEKENELLKQKLAELQQKK
jgi:predicted transposase/invertase (TIGR01784 family)